MTDSEINATPKLNSVPTNEPIDTSDLFPDYLVECDEHLTGARRLLLQLESNPAEARREHLDGLFRHFHTIKGLSGIAAVREAELLAHHLEEYLGALRKNLVSLTPAGVDALVAGARTLEGAISARRDGTPPPEFNALIAQLTALTNGTAAPTANPNAARRQTPISSAHPPDKPDHTPEVLRTGNRVWRVTFTPTPVLSERGVNVSTVRERLRVAGEIVRAEPITVPGGGISFAFLVTSSNADFPSHFAGDGLRVEPYESPAPEPVVEPSRSVPLAPSNIVRVDLGKLDELMRTLGELVITRARLDGVLGRVSALLPAAERRELQETSLTVERQLRALRDGVMRVRLVPIRDVFTRMRFVVRDLTRETGQEIELGLTGEGTEIDKFVVERLADPLLHLVRNAISHGMEPVAERITAGKPARGRIDLRTVAAGGAVVIEVEDDGRGIDAERVFARARAAGLTPPGGWSDPGAVLDLICSPGFSTRDSTDRASGRGVGMDVVRRAIEELGGTLDLVTRPGRGTRFTARLPLTLAIADALIVTVGPQTYAAPQAAVREVILVEPDTVTAFENNELIRHHGGVLPLLRLTDLFRAPEPTTAFPALVVGEGLHAIAIAVDRVIGLREIVVRQLSDPLVQVPGLAGATELGDGRAVLILDAVGLARYARTRRPH
ncbi:chemotaxis protein : Histidine kinase OS=Crinalium epipsammum PCC 9333 GN=Cri9333_3522 PE=4 SV=1: Hpt: H-kinase_dim: HATPase_c: CheW [Gemmata massiliana]|uniref:histidine kinase n=1 Tax=Gemmata massiliana TaxID=1210884 RepID=A0A6P2D1R1_9BACT|nr:chemotaxis protein CheA [Gemmata massiliana]VTR94044.1 chemotaxis protein : Histidine kinase OS=Crinalium epipsammum PCC 9333 GN=Cri9333_3522 PE=4 SV=1: Hpt: H-kinase_dim: HATPase_c: CheW [Gemmata massiliana]